MESGKSGLEMMDIEGAQLKMDAFCSKWGMHLYKLCNTDQKLAIWHLWTRFLLGLRSLRWLAPHSDVSGCYVMARCCLEYDVGISAIINKPELGESYVNYDVHAKNKFLEAQRHRRSQQEIADLEQYMANRFGPDFAKKKATSWHGGFKQLCIEAGRESDMELYVAYCQHAHGTITGMYMLNEEGLLKMQNMNDSAWKLLSIYTLTFLKTTDRVVKLIFSDLWSPDKEECLQAFECMAESIARPQQN